ncbi:parathyroid hormone/parathyroid hormone-related peptide receptor [Plakobranchus ocellatus]|uniref:Parathyroid hormone/parathyroid hormone-related peptide receptor n=1 Tax=Plakobranchus ocellatus TaxID=259542 RepID=A0AAV4A8N7_9GAST|nr:parathyroid hormone/parathyroid hormone-related peptide receptor [Plakobranchus ocellatus]
MVLIPLCGLTYIVFYVAVPSSPGDSDFEVTYLYLEMAYNSFQGFIIALLFCFLNEDVHKEIKRAWHSLVNRRQQMYTRNRSWPEQWKQQTRPTAASYCKHLKDQQQQKQQDDQSQRQQFQQLQHKQMLYNNIDQHNTNASDRLSSQELVDLPYIDS